MATNINVVVVSGNLTRDPETRQTTNSSVTKFGLAVNERTKESGEWGERANFFNVTVWGAMGENVAKYLSKGSGCVVSGRLRWSKWETQDGETRQSVEIVAEQIQFMPKGSGGGGGGQPQQRSDVPNDNSDFEPESAPAAAGSYDDIPF